MPKKPRASMGQGMFDWASTSPGRVDPRTGRLVDQRSFFGPPAAPPALPAPPAYAPPRFARSYSAREPYYQPEYPQQQAATPGMFSWVSPGQSGRMSGPGGSSAALWVGLSIVIGAGVMIALEATGVTNITRSTPKA